MKKVCFLVSEHPFLDARIFKKEAKSLAKHGFNVTMIVPRKKGYLFDVDGTVFTDRFLKDDFVYEGIRIKTYDQEQIRPDDQWKQFYRHLLKAGVPAELCPLMALGILENADIYHAHELYSLYAGVMIKRSLLQKGKHPALIYDSHELEPDPLVKEADRIKKIKRESLKIMLKATDTVITVSPSIKSWFHSLDETVPAEVIYNSPPLSAPPRAGQGKNRELVLAFEGVMNEKRGSFSKLMAIIEKSNRQFPLRAMIIGGNKRTEKELEIPPSIKDQVTLTGWIDYSKIEEAMQGADIGWIDLDARHSLSYRYAMPNKFFSYLTNGLPVLVNQCPDMATFIEKHDCGYVVPGLEASRDDTSRCSTRFIATAVRWKGRVNRRGK